MCHNRNTRGKIGEVFIIPIAHDGPHTYAPLLRFYAGCHGSVITWKHFNLHGEFDFSDEKMIDSIGLTLPKNHPL